MASIAVNFTLFDDNDQYVQLTGLFSLSGDGFGNLTVKNYESGATVTATLYDVNGAPVAGLTNISMPYVAGSQGIYRGKVGAAFDAKPGKGLYTLVITAQSGPSQLQFNIPTTIQKRVNQ